MPTVLRFDGLRVVVCPNDRRPAHVHVKGAAGEALFILHCPDGPPTLSRELRLQPAELSRIEDELAGADGL